MRVAHFYHFIFVICIVLAGSGCSWMPKVKIPFIGGGSGSHASGDPDLPFNVRQTLGYGQTLKLVVWRGQSSPSKIYAGKLMVNQKGLIHFKEAGDVRVGGLTALQAINIIEASFHRLHQYSASVIHVELTQIEHVPLVTVTGAVRSPAVIQWFDGITASSALPYVGGRKSHPNARAVYVTRKGIRRFHAGAENVALEPGDTVAFSSDL